MIFLKFKNHSFPIFSISIGCLMLSMTSCHTRLDIKPDGSGRYLHDGSRVGVDYALPMLQFKLSVTRALTQCQNKDKKIDVKFLVKVKAEPHYVAGERYVIDYEALSSWSKTSKFELQTYDNGVIKSINAEAEDQSAAIIGDVVKSGISILSLASGVPGGNGDTPLPDPLWACTSETMRMLAQIDQYTTDLEARAKELTSLNDEVVVLEYSASKGALSEDGKKRLEKTKDELKEKSKLVKGVDENLEKFVDRVSISEEIIWPKDPKGDVLDASPSPENRKKVIGLFSADVKNIGGYTLDKLESRFQLSGKLAAVVSSNPQIQCVKEPATDQQKADCKQRVDESAGIFYRSPIPARLVICQSTAKECTNDGATSVVVSDSVLAPQLGERRLLPFSNGIFENNSIAVAFRENGGISKLNFDEKTARGKSLSGAVSSGLESVVAYRDAKLAYESAAVDSKKKAEDEKSKAELDKLDHEISLLEKQQKLDGLREESSLNASLQDTKVETTRLSAHLALLEAQKKIKETQDALDKLNETSR